MKHIWCNGFPEIYAQLEEGVQSMCHGYMCIVQYMKLMWCHGFAEIYAQLKEGETYVVLWFWRDVCLIGGGGQSDIGICPLFYIYRSAMRCAKFGVAVLKASMVDWGCQSAIGICALCYI